MTPDEMKELRELVEFLKENDLNEFEFERGELKIRLKFAQPAGAASALDISRLGQFLTPAVQGTVPSTPAAHAAATSASVSSAAQAADVLANEEKLHIVKSPIVG